MQDMQDNWCYDTIQEVLAVKNPKHWSEIMRSYMTNQYSLKDNVIQISQESGEGLKLGHLVWNHFRLRWQKTLKQAFFPQPEFNPTYSWRRNFHLL